MTKQPKLTDLQLVLLSNAAAREDGMLLPPPESVRARGKTLGKTLAKLLGLGLVEEVAAVAPEQGWREDEGREVALRIATAGREALGLSEDAEPGSPDSAPIANEVPSAATAGGTGNDPNGAETLTAPTPPGLRAGTKQLRLASHLGQPGGISIAELSRLLGWQPHTVRAALTGLRKKGFTVTSRKNEEGVTLYSGTPPAEVANDAA